MSAVGYDKGECHRAANQNVVGNIDEAFEDFDFVGNLGASEDDGGGVFGIFNDVGED